MSPSFMSVMDRQLMDLSGVYFSKQNESFHHEKLKVNVHVNKQTFKTLVTLLTF